MVHPAIPSLILVLYCLSDYQWKLVDFGFASEVVSGAAVTSSKGRGSDGYRAPELIGSKEIREFTKKVDIWALGCIMYELLAEEQAFSNDDKTRTYANSS